MNCKEHKLWVEAMDDEYKSLLHNGKWTWIQHPPNRKAIKSKWVYKLKRRTDGSIDRYKARLVAKGFSQWAGLDYTETFSPVVRMDSVRLILGLVAEEDLELMHFDVKTAFPNGSLEEEIFEDQPGGYVKGKGLVWISGKACMALSRHQELGSSVSRTS